MTSSLATETSGSVAQLRRARIAIFGCALFMGFFAILFTWRSHSLFELNQDSYKFADLGRNIIEGRGFAFTDGPPTIRRAPLYPAIIALLYFVFGVNPHTIQIFQCFVAAGTSVLVLEMGHRIFSLRTGVLAAVATAFHPMVWRYVPDIQVEPLLTFLYTLTIYRTVRLVEKESVLNGVWVGAAGAASAMVKSVTLPYVALFIAGYWLWRRRQGRGEPLWSGWKPIGAILITMGVIILPWTYRNYVVTGGRFALVSGNASGEFLRGYVFAQPRYYLLEKRAYEDGENEANAMQIKLFHDQGLVWNKDEAETEKVQNLAANQMFHQHPAAFAKKVMIAFFMFWYVVTTLLNSLVVGSLALLAWILAFFGWAKSRGEHHPFWLVLLPIVSLNCTYALVLALGRYSAPCIPALMVLAAFGADTFLRRRAARATIASG